MNETKRLKQRLSSLLNDYTEMISEQVISDTATVDSLIVSIDELIKSIRQVIE